MKENNLIWLLIALAVAAACALSVGDQTTADAIDTFGEMIVEALR